MHVAILFPSSAASQCRDLEWGFARIATETHRCAYHLTRTGITSRTSSWSSSTPAATQSATTPCRGSWRGPLEEWPISGRGLKSEQYSAPIFFFSGWINFTHQQGPCRCSWWVGRSLQPARLTCLSMRKYDFFLQHKTIIVTYVTLFGSRCFGNAFIKVSFICAFLLLPLRLSQRHCYFVSCVLTKLKETRNNKVTNRRILDRAVEC